MNDIRKLHSSYCNETGLQISLAFDRERAWHEFAKHFTEADLILVIRWLKSGIRQFKRNPGCLKFHNLIERVDYFEEELAEAKAIQRNFRRAPTEKEKVLMATGRSAEQPAIVKTPKSCLPDPAEFAEGLKKVREAL